MRKRIVSFILMTSLLVSGIPAVSVFAEGGSDGKDSSEAKEPAVHADAEYAPDRVIVMYENGTVDTDKPSTKLEKRAQSRAQSHRAASFGQAAASVGQSKVSDTENTLGGQVTILDRSLGDDYVIDDTIVFNHDKRGSDMVISTISSDSMSTEEMIAGLRDNSDIKYVEPDYRIQVDSFPDWDDPYFKDAFQLYGENSVNADAIWESEEYAETNADPDAEPVVVAVVDTGVDYTHPDLADRMWIKPESRAFSKFAGKYGYDFSAYDYDPMDENGHGTHCAGIVAAEANNAAGIVGVAGASDKVKIMALRALDENGTGYTSGIVAAIRYAVEMKKAGVNLCALNFSLGGAVYSEIETVAIEEAGKAGILSVIAAGNETLDIDIHPNSPGGANTDYKITVVAANENGSVASFSNYGMKNTDIAAPGCNILSVSPFFNYMPFLFDAGTLKQNTDYYGTFDGAAVEKVTNAQGELTDAVRPVVGTDYYGEPINDPEDPDHKIGEFGTSVMLYDRVDGSSGSASLEITDDKPFRYAAGEKDLRWKIENASPGDAYILYFPYEKIPGNNKDKASSLVFRFHSEPNGGSSGHIEEGDIKINGVAGDGTPDWTTMDDEGRTVNYAYNDVWLTGAKKDSLFSYQDVKDVHTLSSTKGIGREGTIRNAESEEEQIRTSYEGYGLGIVYIAETGGDCYIDISSLAIPKPDMDPNTLVKYNVMSGTSQATPVVTGAAAIIAAMNPGIAALDLKAALLAATDDNYEGWCSSGGMLDLGRYTAPAGNSKPAIMDAAADPDKDEVRLQGQGFGTSFRVEIRRNVSGSGEDHYEPIDNEDLRMEDGSIIISKAREKYGIIGSDVSFKVKNNTNGMAGTATFYVVNGLAPYREEFRIPANHTVRSDPFTGEKTYLADLKFISGANDLLFYDYAGNIYRSAAEQGGGHVYQIGRDAQEAVNTYLAGICADESKRDSLWNKADRNTVCLLSKPAYMGGRVYELLSVDLEYIRGVLLLGLDLSGDQKWTVYYDSIDGFGTEPDQLSWPQIGRTTLTGYKGRLYVFGSVRNEEIYGVEDKNRAYGESDIMTSVFSCEPELPVTKGVEWREEAELVLPRADGIPVSQGGNLYYVLSCKSAMEHDYTVYRFDGSKWTAAGTLPEALNDSLSCAVGIDDTGILFGGWSFNGLGDTFRFNTATGKTEPLDCTLWGTNSMIDACGVSAEGRLWASYLTEDDVIFKTIDMSNGYVRLRSAATGAGSGSISGTGSYAKGDTSKAVIIPDEGSYIYSAESKGTGHDISLNEIKSNFADNVKKRQQPVTVNYDAVADGNLDVVFGKISTKVDMKSSLSQKIGTFDLNIKTDGTINDVDLVSSNDDYAVVNKDGTVTFKEAGVGKTVTLTATAKDDPQVRAECKVTILLPVKLTDSDVTLKTTSYTYDGKAKTPAVTVKSGGTVLTQGKDYTVKYASNTNAGTATATITGEGNYAGSVTKKYTIKAASLAKARVTAKNQTYTGKKLTPAVTVKLGSVTLKKGTDHTVSYASNINAGTATVTVKGKGNYTGTAKGTFKINKAANPLKVKVSSKTYDRSKLTKEKTFSIGTTKAQGKVTYTPDKNARTAKIRVTAKGKVTIPKKCKKGTYKITVKAAGGNNYKAGTKTVTVKIK